MTAPLDPEQQLAVAALRGPVCILAGAGTGKTRTVTYRIAQACLSGEVPSSAVLALSHSQKAAGEMRHRLQQLGVGSVAARTFHSAALRQLRHFWSRTGRDGNLEIADNRYSLVRGVLERGPRGKDNDDVVDLTNEISWAKSTLLTPETYAAAAKGRILPRSAAEIADIFGAYEKLKGSRCDFEDILSLTADLIERDRDVADQVRSTYWYFTVDEYQDVDPLQQRLLDAWLGEGDDVCAVGDDRQCIFSFKGAQPAFLRDFADRWPQGTVIDLVRDYRSTPQVVELANRLMRGSSSSLIGQRADGPEPQLLGFSDESAEEHGIVRSIKAHLAAGTPANEIAVLYRFNSQSARIESALNLAGIPFGVLDGDRFFQRSEVLGVLLEFAKRAGNAPDEVGVDVLHDVLGEGGWDRDTPPAGAGAARQRWESLAALVALVDDIAGSATLAAPYLLAELRHRAAENHDPGATGVVLSTLHKAKGLEWDVVYLPGLTEGSLPSVYAKSKAEVEEERRLLYVGITRAREHLWLSWAAKNGRGWKNTVSRFFDELNVTRPPATSSRRRGATSSSVTGTVKRSGGCAGCGAALPNAPARKLGRCFSCLSGRDALLRDKLISWRDEVEPGRPGNVLSDRAIVTLVAGASEGVELDLSGIVGVGAAARARSNELRALLAG